MVTKTFLVDDAGPPNEDDALLTTRSDITHDSDGLFNRSNTWGRTATPYRKKVWGFL